MDITIAGLGPGNPGALSLEVWETLQQTSRRIFLRTEKHPVVPWLRQKGIIFETFDRFYENGLNFEEVYRRIASEVLERACEGPVLYAVPGHPLVAEESVNLIMEGARKKGLSFNILAGESFLDALLSALKLDPFPGLKILNGLSLDKQKPDPGAANVVIQVYNRLTACDVKLRLMEHYPDDYRVTVVRAAGVPGQERVEKVPLFKLDRLDWIDHLSSIYIPQKKLIREEGNSAGTVEKNKKLPATSFRNKTLPNGALNKELNEESNKTLNGACRFPLDPLVDVMAKLRGRNGCPWDREQTHQSLKRYLLEETYEVLEALDTGNVNKICEELGDLLLQVVFHCQIAREHGKFDINDVISGITEKMIRRHPHVFGNLEVRDSDEVLLNWDAVKKKEREGDRKENSIMAGIPKTLPALLTAFKIQARAARVGFDWPDYSGAAKKVREELSEVLEAVDCGEEEKVKQEIGDLLFAAVNLARLLGVDAEEALSNTNKKFKKRFNYIEQKARQKNTKLADINLQEMDNWWEEAKKTEKF